MQRKWKKMSNPASIYKEVDKLNETFFQRNIEFTCFYIMSHFEGTHVNK